MIKETEVAALLGAEKWRFWQELCSLIESRYTMDVVIGKGGKAWDYEYKYRHGGKTLCALYAKEKVVGFLVIFGVKERNAFEAQRDTFSSSVQAVYDAAKTYHDGKWMMFFLENSTDFQEFMKLLLIKRKPNKK